jgi:hypothetical protein
MLMFRSEGGGTEGGTEGGREGGRKIDRDAKILGIICRER